MLKQFLNHIQLHQLCKTTDKILLAVSGGVDSMVMLQLFVEGGFKVGVAHCNFQLRREDSLADEALVNATCVRYKIPFYVQRFDTEKYAQQKSLSIQMAARELRYEFFKSVADVHQYQLIATAHHLSDSLETVLLNLVRGTGIKGVAGIPVRNKNVIRPLLFATRSQIQEYADFRRIEWREDVSNLGVDYQRNFIRHEVVSKLKELNPKLEITFNQTAERLHAAGQIFKNYCEIISKTAVTLEGTKTKIERSVIDSSLAPTVVLSELIRDFGFHYSQSKSIVEPHQAGKKFLSPTHELAITSTHFLIRERDFNNRSSSQILIDADTVSANNGTQSIELSILPVKNFELSMDSSFAQLDFDKLKFPITWRRWRAGDAFVPLGMHSSKKVSDFLIDAKVSSFDKEQVTVLESAGEIVWLVNYRINDRFKVSSQSKTVMIVR